MPAPIRLTYLGVSRTPEALLEAARAFGATPMQVLTKVELPSPFDDSVTFPEMLAMFHGADERVSEESVLSTARFLASVIEHFSDRIAAHHG